MTSEQQSQKDSRQVRFRFGWKQKALLILFGVLVAHVALEVLLRLWGFARYYELTHKGSDHPDSALVILAVGDSVTYGYCSSNPETKSYPARLERLAKRHAPQQDIRVEKMGFPGANSSQIARRLGGFLDLHDPDVLLLLIGNNDVWNLKHTRAEHFVEGADWSDRLALTVAEWLDGIHVVRFYKWMAMVIDNDDDEFKAMKGVAPTRKHYGKGLKLFGDMKNIQRLYEYNFREMLDAAEKRGVKTVVLDYHNPSWEKETEYLRPALDNLGIEMFDLEPYFKEAEAKGRKVITDKSIAWHPNDFGYGIIARAVFNELVRRGIIEANLIDPVVPEKTNLRKQKGNPKT